MKPFNLEAAKRGDPVVTREGFPVRIVCWDKQGLFPLVGLVRITDQEEVVVNFSSRGWQEVAGFGRLMMQTKKYTQYINLYDDGVTTAHVSPLSAQQYADEYRDSFVGTREITWEV